MNLALRPAPPEPGGAPPVDAAPQPPAARVDPVPPSFDIVRVGRDGTAVMAGRATPGAEVIIRDGDGELGRVLADRRGDWVFLPDEPLPPGEHQLRLSARTADGQVTEAADPVVVIVPERGGTGGSALAVKLTDEGGELLYAPERRRPVTFDVATQLALEGLYLMGSAPPGSWLDIYYDRNRLGRVLADETGRWRLAARIGITPGNHLLAAEHLAIDGKVMERVEVVLAAPLVEPAPAKGGVSVSRGEGQWSISRDRPGGVDRTVVFDAEPPRPAPAEPPVSDPR